MIRKEIVICIIGLCFVLTSVVGASFVDHGCNCPCCEDQKQGREHSQAASNCGMADDYEIHRAHNSCCFDSAQTTKKQNIDAGTVCVFTCGYSLLSALDCPCAQAIEAKEYLPASSSYSEISYFSRCLGTAGALSHEGSSRHQLVFAQENKFQQSSPLFLQNSSFLL